MALSTVFLSHRASGRVIMKAGFSGTWFIVIKNSASSWIQTVTASLAYRAWLFKTNKIVS